MFILDECMHATYVVSLKSFAITVGRQSIWSNRPDLVAPSGDMAIVDNQ